MAITTKVRKTLWARSGNRCAICKAELVAEENEHNKNLNLGDECHIVSEQLAGPRHIENYSRDYDGYENLILLCKNHHRTVDELWETYTSELLQTIKANHEKWVKTTLDAAQDKRADKVKKLPRLTTGKQIVDIISEVQAYKFDHDEFESEEEAEFISGFLQTLEDWGDISGFGSFDIGRQIKLGFDLNKDIEEVEKRGFLIFGERQQSKMTNSNKDDLGVWDIAFIVVMRKSNSSIVKE